MQKFKNLFIRSKNCAFDVRYDGIHGCFLVVDVGFNGLVNGVCSDELIDVCAMDIIHTSVDSVLSLSIVVRCPLGL